MLSLLYLHIVGIPLLVLALPAVPDSSQLYCPSPRPLCMYILTFASLPFGQAFLDPLQE